MSVLARAPRVGRGLSALACLLPGRAGRPSPAALAAAIAADAERVPGVSRASAAVVGPRAAPALRLSLWLREGASAAQVWRSLDEAVVRPARESLGVAALPTAVRLELGGPRREGRTG